MYVTSLVQTQNMYVTSLVQTQKPHSSSPHPVQLAQRTQIDLFNGAQVGHTDIELNSQNALTTATNVGNAPNKIQ